MINKVFLNNSKKKKILIFGEKAEKSAPSLTLFELLSSYGHIVDCSFLPDSTFACLKKFSRYDVAIFIYYGEPSDWFVHKISLSCLVNTPVFRYWVGSDVLYAIENNRLLKNIKKLDLFVAKNFAVAPHLVLELGRIGIQAEVLPIVSPVFPDSTCSWSPDISKNVLIYLPRDKEDFYGASILDDLIQSLTDITFIIIANGGNRYRDNKNVINYGWIENMNDIYANIGSVLRITKHDGLPRMIIEALAHGKYVIYSWPLDGCLYANNYDEAKRCLLDISNKNNYNEAGLEIVKNKYSQSIFNQKFIDAFSSLPIYALIKFIVSLLGLFLYSFKAIKNKIYK